MYYKIQSANSKQVVVTLDKTYSLISKIVSAVGLIILLIAVSKFLKDKGADRFADDFHRIFNTVLFVMGIMFLYVGIMLPRMNKSIQPQKIVFNNELGIIELYGQNSIKRQKAIIAYDEVEAIDYRAEKVHMSDSDSYNYYVYFRKEDGGMWDFFSSVFEQPSKDFCQKINEFVDVKKPTKGKVKSSLPSSFSKGQHQGNEIIKWRNKMGVNEKSGILFLVLFTTVFVLIMSLFWSEISLKSGFDIFPIIILLFICGVFLFVIGGIVYKMIKNVFRSYGLMISKQQVEYLEFSNVGNVKKTKSINIKEIHSLVYNYSLNNNTSKLFFFSNDYSDLKYKYDRGDLQIEDILEVIQNRKDLLQIEIPTISAINMLQLEGYIQLRIKELGGHEVL